MNVMELSELYLNKKLRRMVSKVDEAVLEKAEEIRMRVNMPLYIYGRGQEYYINRDGITAEWINSYKPTKEDINQTLELMSEYSIYAFNEEIIKGYLSLQGGIRVGLVGKTVVENDTVKTIKNISGLNIRISRQVIGCSNILLDYINEGQVYNTLIVSPPACGKTTMLRDIVRELSNDGNVIGLVDERSEIAGTYLGNSQLDVGRRTDILDCCPKAIGMKMLLRSMAPDIIVADEIGSVEDIRAIDDVMNSGVKLICTVHGSNIDELRQRSTLRELIEKKVFERYVVLSKRMGVGTIEGIYDRELRDVWQ